MELQGSIDTLPKVAVLDRRHFAEPLPLPIVRSPVCQTIVQATTNVPAGSHQSDVRRARQSLQTANNSEQLESFAMSVWLSIGSFKLLAAIDGLQNEPPLSAFECPIGLGEEEKARRVCFHGSVVLSKLPLRQEPFPLASGQRLL
jgi:hypothetical protein